MAYSLLRIVSSLAAMICLVTMFAGCTTGYKTISQAEAQKIINGKKDYILLDVRTPEEYEKKHIPNAVLLPIAEIKAGNVAETLPDKKQKILVYCWTGRRAEDSAIMLADMGYSNVISFGGLIDWTGDLEGTEAN